MQKAPSTILATAGITVGMLGFTLPASASTPVAANQPAHGQSNPQFPGGPQSGGVSGPQSGGSTNSQQGFGGPDGNQTPVVVHHPTQKPIQHHPKPKQSHPKPKRKPWPPKPEPVVYHPQPKPTPMFTCHPQPPKPKHHTNPVRYTKGWNPSKTQGQADTLYSWQQPKPGHTIKCDSPEPVPLKRSPVPPKHRKFPQPKKHGWKFFQPDQFDTIPRHPSGWRGIYF